MDIKEVEKKLKEMQDEQVVHYRNFEIRRIYSDFHVWERDEYGMSTPQPLGFFCDAETVIFNIKNKWL